jgi:glucans biosynthesis protein
MGQALGEDGGEVAAFLDASYFRMIGYGQDYGSSARGLALNTVANESEEFPAFQQFWIRRPGKNDKDITVYALMDSRSVAGAYRFNIRPGTATVASVTAAIFPRREVKEFGIAALTSMFLYGKNGHVPFRDFRPEVHDADGLLIHNGRASGFGVPRRQDDTVASFQDNSQTVSVCCNASGILNITRSGGTAHHRPASGGSVGNWEKAGELVELASDQEYWDNVVAFWKPAVAPAVGHALEIEYELHWSTNSPSPPELGHVRATRTERMVGKPPHLRFVVEFGGAAVESLPGKENLTANIDYGAGVKRVTHLVKMNQPGLAFAIEIVEPPP